MSKFFATVVLGIVGSGMLATGMLATGMLTTASAQAATVDADVAYILKGYWYVGGSSSNGKTAPAATTNPKVFSGLEAAAELFGPSTFGYAISTNLLSEVVENAGQFSVAPFVFTAGDVVEVLADGTYRINGVLQTFEGQDLHYEVNKLSFLDGWGDATYLSNPQPQTYSLDVVIPGDPSTIGYYQPPFVGAAYSAWVSDHAGGQSALNYAFVPVPEPGAWAMMAGGLALLSFVGWSRRKIG